MTTFKVGDKVRVLDVSAIKRGEKHYFNGMETEVVSMYDGITGRYPKLRNKYGDPGISIHSQELHAIERIKTKTTKNQRISALEKKVEYLESVIDSLTHKKWTEDDLNEIEEQVLTNNQKRAAIIEKAKKFVEEQKDKRGYVTAPNQITCTIDFVVNPDKRTVVALLRGIATRNVWSKGIAKCHPHDVFNEHIGKAIALGRALGLDVSEFEQAVQPD